MAENKSISLSSVCVDKPSSCSHFLAADQVGWSICAIGVHYLWKFDDPVAVRENSQIFDMVDGYDQIDTTWLIKFHIILLSTPFICLPYQQILLLYFYYSFKMKIQSINLKDLPITKIDDSKKNYDRWRHTRTQNKSSNFIMATNVDVVEKSREMSSSQVFLVENEEVRGS